MQRFRKSKRFISLAVAIVFLSSPLFAQQKRGVRKPAQVPAPAPRPVPAPAPAPTFDTLLAADSYRVYSEVRSVGQLVLSPAITDLLDPLIKLGSPPKEFKTVVKWIKSQADTLASSRMMLASWPAQPKLPSVLIAIEFDSAEEAQKFDAKLRGFIPTLLPTPTPTPTPAPTGYRGPAVTIVPPASIPGQESEPALPPYQIKQAGSLVLLSDKPFAFKDLTPRGSKLLSEDPNFVTARNRFASESIFVYVDVKSIEKENTERLKKYEEEQKQRELEAASRPTPEETEVDPDSEENQPEPVYELRQVEPPVPGASPQGQLETTQPTIIVPMSSSGPNVSMLSFYSLLFGAQSKWPEAVGVALAFEGDAYVLRTLIMNTPDNKGSAIPFVPLFVSGPALVPEAAGVLPADSDFFVTLSLDYVQVYEAMLKSAAAADEMARKYGGRPVSAPSPESPFAAYEKKLGIKIKDDLLPLFGNEIALALPKTTGEATKSQPDPAEPTPENSDKKSPPPPEPNPVIAISIKDREAVKRLIPKIIESLGFKGANLLAQTEKRDDTEITSYAGVFSYAFVGNFLVLSPDQAATRHVVDSFLKHQTLSSDSHFRNTIRWQPRQVQGQVYVAPDLVERYYPLTLSGTAANDKMRDFLSRLSPVLDPVSYALTNDGLGPLHELHVPRNLLMLMVAGMSTDAGEPPVVGNESMAKSVLRTISTAEEMFQSTKGDGRYGTLDELTAAGLVHKSTTETNGYRIEVAVSGKKFEATAVPIEYGKSGLLSYFIDESGVLRGGDHGGGNATVADNPVN